MAVFFKPALAIVAVFVDDDGRLANANRPKAIEGVADQRPSADRRHWLADAKAVCPQASPMASGDDASPQEERFWPGRHVRMSRISGKLITVPRMEPSSATGRSAAWTCFGAIQMKLRPERRAPS